MYLHLSNTVMPFLKVRCNKIVSGSRSSVLNRVFKCHYDKIAAMWKDESVLSFDLFWCLTSSCVTILLSYTRIYYPRKDWIVLQIQKANYLIKYAISCHVPSAKSNSLQKREKDTIKCPFKLYYQLFPFLIHTSLLSNHQHEFCGCLAWPPLTHTKRRTRQWLLSPEQCHPPSESPVWQHLPRGRQLSFVRPQGFFSLSDRPSCRCSTRLGCPAGWSKAMRIPWRPWKRYAHHSPPAMRSCSCRQPAAQQPRHERHGKRNRGWTRETKL